MKRIFSFAASVILLMSNSFASDTNFDFEIDGILYTITNNNEVEIQGIADEINPERQTPDVLSDYYPGYCIGNEIHYPESVFPKFYITPTYLSFPESVEWNGKTYLVVSLGQSAMCDVNFTHIRFPPTLKKIGEKAFLNSGVYHIDGIESVSEIGIRAFAYCFMDSLTLSEEINLIPEFCFSCSWIKQLTIDGNPEFKEESFFCSEIGHITCNGLCPKPINCGKVFSFASVVMLPLGEKRYGAPYHTYLHIPAASFDKYMDQGWKQFADANIIAMPQPCWHIEIDIPGSNYTLYGIPRNDKVKELNITGVCSDISSDVFIPTSVDIDRTSYSVTEINRNAFYDCRLKDITLPPTIEKIGSYAFANSKFSDLKGIGEVRQIGKGAFEGSYFNSLSFPHAISSVESYMFTDAHIKKIVLDKATKEIYATAIGKLFVDTLVCLAENPPSIYVDDPYAHGIYDHSDNLYYLYVPQASIDKYKTAEYFKDFHNILPIEQSTAIKASETDNTPDYTLDGHRLTMALDAAEATILNTAGQLIAQLRPGQSLTLPPGFYILRTASKTTKVALQRRD